MTGRDGFLLQRKPPHTIILVDLPKYPVIAPPMVKITIWKFQNYICQGRSYGRVFWEVLSTNQALSYAVAFFVKGSRVCRFWYQLYGFCWSWYTLYGFNIKFEFNSGGCSSSKWGSNVVTNISMHTHHMLLVCILPNYFTFLYPPLMIFKFICASKMLSRRNMTGFDRVTKTFTLYIFPPIVTVLEPPLNFEFVRN